MLPVMTGRVYLLRSKPILTLQHRVLIDIQRDKEMNLFSHILSSRLSRDHQADCQETQ